ncbi:hypothetical protein THAOC_01509 [Thalassiosira oceanica]|uniref:Uncharacterized protein n=1 Tax=Thalassiosira oceanica TaxID=159749 RepID=K0TI99_THAOC|nr:hypothetical protein THAOC_01509 [Thalassiosira oceanica]|eukprot:EJK76714.1 hypothetical protein THAOC_01509 [Thalassiosira oceanica]
MYARGSGCFLVGGQSLLTTAGQKTAFLHWLGCLVSTNLPNYWSPLAKLLESELGGRRCEIANLPSRPELNGKTCVVDEYLPGSNEYKVTLETKSKEVLVLGPDNLTRRDRTPQDCGYYIEFKNGRTIRHDFDSSEDCKAFVASLNSSDETPPAVTEEAEAAAELLAELGLGESSNNVATSGNKVKRSKKKKGGKKKKNKGT